MRNEKLGIGEGAPAGAQRKHPADVKLRQGRRTPPSPSVTPPLTGEACLRQFPKGAPARGAVGASRLRGASPPGGRDTLQKPAGPCMRRGRCLHRPASFPAAAAAFSGPMKNHRPLRRLCAARKDTGKGNAAMHPSVCACGASTSPYRGGFLRQRSKGAPARGAVGASRRRGAWPPGGRDILQKRAGPCMRRGRCLHRPAACPRRRQRGLMRASLPARAAQTSRRCKGPARCRTPLSPSVPPPLAGEAFLKAAAQGGHAAPAPPPLLHTCGTNRTFS